MAQWGRNDQAVTANSTTTIETSTGAPMGVYALVKGSGNGDNPVSMAANAHFGNTSPGSRANVDSSLFNNSTPGAFVTNLATGVFGVSVTEMSNNTTNNSKEQPAHAGWVFRKAGTGPVVSIAVSGGSGFQNNETITVSGGEVNATAFITTNTTGGLSTATVNNAGSGFVNSTSITSSFDREKRVVSITVSGSPTGYNNTDVIVLSNSTVGISNGAASISTNSTGGFVTANVTITKAGLFTNAAINGSILFTALAANGAASAGSGATFSGTLANSTGGTITVTLGGRSGRVQTETLVAFGSLGTNTTSSTGVTGLTTTVVDATSDNTFYPGT